MFHLSRLLPRIFFKPEIPTEPSPTAALGKLGELIASEALEQAGYNLVGANFKLPIGRNRRGAVVHAEVDIVAFEGPVLCFIEVKSRASDWFAPPQANVDLRKQRQISRAARVYRRMFNLQSAPYRYDVVSVLLPGPDPKGHSREPRTRILRGFWSDENFRKRRWSIYNPSGV